MVPVGKDMTNATPHHSSQFRLVNIDDLPQAKLGEEEARRIRTGEQKINRGGESKQGYGKMIDGCDLS